jgi:ATP-binding cassette subfamily F protein 3
VPRDKIAIVGYNGMGKTTLMRLMAGILQPTQGKCQLGHNVIIGYQSQEITETIPNEITVLGCAKRAAPDMLEKSLRNQLASFGFTADDINKTAGVLSGGEKIRLAFLQLFLNPPNFMLLDEPTTHLDLEGRRALEEALIKYDGTICFVSHDVAFVRAVATTIIEITPAGVRRFAGNYDYYREKLEKENNSSANSQLSATTTPQGASANADTSNVKNDALSLSSRELRQARAQARAKLQPLIRRLKEKVTLAETRIATLEEEHAQLTAQLSSGNGGIDFAAHSRRLKQIEFDLHKLTLDWEANATELEQLEQQQAADLKQLEGNI